MTVADPEALRVLFRVLDALDTYGIPYHVGGSYASAIHGVPRQTHDLDLVVEMGFGHAETFARSLAGEFFVDEDAVARAVAERSSCNLVHYGTGVKVDLFVKGPSEFDAAEFDRRMVFRLGGNPPREVFVKSAEDTLLRKLLWFRLGDEASDRQWEDVRGIVRVQGERLDLDYVLRWANLLGIRDLVDRVLAG